MAKIYRAMRHVDGVPIIEDSVEGIGVRTADHEAMKDIEVDAAGCVSPGSGGMSVAPDWRRLPPFFIPQRLKDKFRRARGEDHLACFRLDMKEYVGGPLSDKLVLGKVTNKHACVEPDAYMSLEDYKEALHKTQDVWELDES